MFRGYDPQLGRFNQVDPLAELFYAWTPYQFGFNDPIFWSDPLGLSPQGNSSYAICPTCPDDPYCESSDTYIYEEGLSIFPFLETVTVIGERKDEEGDSEWFGYLGDVANSGGLVAAGLAPTFRDAASLAKHNPSGSVPLWLKKNIFEETTRLPNNNALKIGNLKGSAVLKINRVTSVAGPAMGALSVVSTGADIISDGELSAGDGVQALITGAQIVFPVFGVIYGAIDLGFTVFTDQSLTSRIKEGIDSNINGSIKLK